MDTTEEYATMMSKATEILENWKFKNGDYVYRWDKSEAFVLYYSKNHGSPPPRYTMLQFSTPLPRQDQLQEMIDTDIDTLISGFIHTTTHRLMFINKLDVYYKLYFDSMEKIWLGFTMLQKFNKIWDGKDWIKSE